MKGETGFLLLAAFWDGVLFHPKESEPPSTSFRCDQRCRNIYALSIAGSDGFRIRQVLVLARKFHLVFSPSILSHDYGSVSKGANQWRYRWLGRTG